MQSLKCSLSLVVALGLCHMCMAMPGRYIRASDDGSLIQLQLTDDVNDLNPINAEVCYKFNSILCIYVYKCLCAFSFYYTYMYMYSYVCTIFHYYLMCILFSRLATFFFNGFLFVFILSKFHFFLFACFHCLIKKNSKRKLLEKQKQKKKNAN